MGKTSKFGRRMRNAQREADGLFRLYSDDTAEGCRIVRWIAPEIGDRMVRQHDARPVVDERGMTIGYQLHRSFMRPQPVRMARV